jgi:adenylate kinase
VKNGLLRVVLVAPPGAGKGTQGDRLAAAYRVPHLSSGEILRAEVLRGSSVGLLVADALQRGELVPDEVVTAAIFERVGGPDQGFVLDGFPRTLSQAVATDEWAASNGRPLLAAIELQVPHEELVARLTRRAAHSSRPDDTEDVIRHRLIDYGLETQPVVDYYRQRGLLITIDGTGEIQAVTDRIRAQLDALLRVQH